MPIYVYRCVRCNHEDELISRAPKTNVWCTACKNTYGMAKMERVPTAASIKFQGYGWAADGYASPEKPAKKK